VEWKGTKLADSQILQLTNFADEKPNLTMGQLPMTHTVQQTDVPILYL